MPSADRRFYPSESDPDSSDIYVPTHLLRLQPLILRVSVIRWVVELLAIVLPGNAAFDELVREHIGRGGGGGGARSGACDAETLGLRAL